MEIMSFLLQIKTMHHGDSLGVALIGNFAHHLQEIEFTWGFGPFLFTTLAKEET